MPADDMPSPEIKEAIVKAVTTEDTTKYQQTAADINTVSTSLSRGNEHLLSDIPIDPLLQEQYAKTIASLPAFSPGDDIDEVSHTLRTHLTPYANSVRNYALNTLFVDNRLNPSLQNFYKDTIEHYSSALLTKILVGKIAANWVIMPLLKGDENNPKEPGKYQLITATLSKLSNEAGNQIMPIPETYLRLKTFFERLSEKIQNETLDLNNIQRISSALASLNNNFNAEKEAVVTDQENLIAQFERVSGLSLEKAATTAAAHTDDDVATAPATDATTQVFTPNSLLVQYNGLINNNLGQLSQASENPKSELNVFTNKLDQFLQDSRVRSIVDVTDIDLTGRPSLQKTSPAPNAAASAAAVTPAREDTAAPAYNTKPGLLSRLWQYLKEKITAVFRKPTLKAPVNREEQTVAQGENALTARSPAIAEIPQRQLTASLSTDAILAAAPESTAVSSSVESPAPTTTREEPALKKLSEAPTLTPTDNPNQDSGSIPSRPR